MSGNRPRPASCKAVTLPAGRFAFQAGCPARHSVHKTSCAWTNREHKQKPGRMKFLRIWAVPAHMLLISWPCAAESGTWPILLCFCIVKQGVRAEQPAFFRQNGQKTGRNFGRQGDEFSLQIEEKFDMMV